MGVRWGEGRWEHGDSLLTETDTVWSQSRTFRETTSETCYSGTSLGVPSRELLKPWCQRSMAILRLPKQTLSGYRTEPLGKLIPKNVILGLNLAFPRVSYSSVGAREAWRFFVYQNKQCLVTEQNL